ncbi:hypothetical protein GCM10011321_31750 [Youhaiella tibetensis]|uniref:Uncharacterized protein n=1 Tax=Paradevosia tibetensis TaxID=1447062 RepID=A0A5B9DIJ1_9HYPH|nr:hypothetical protein [Youhaiella tibetensis]QEE18866.1 hypothetical protein FNA67_01140 [Youhaiella tibetensis]GGF38477.1 hypothetical protein GCM10011321_31750 [Youhaiella tibetensis]
MKSAIQLIREADRGQLLTDMEGALQEIVNAMELYGGTGDMTIKLKVKKKGDAYMIGSELKFTVPQPPRIEAMFFFDADEGEFTRRDPRQPQIPSVVQAADFNPRRNPTE